jgi:DNA-binding transcriptional LysR family regulator
VSQQLGVLERELGLAVLERQGRRVVLTPAGRALVDGADDVFHALEHASSSALAAAAVQGGPVHVGSFASVGATVVPTAFAALRRSHPDVEPHFRLHDDEGFDQLKLGHLDIWIDQHYTNLPRPGAEGFADRTLLTEPVCLAVPTADDRGPDLAAYRDEVWVGGHRKVACGRLLERLAGDAGFVPDLRFLTEDLEGILQFVTAGVAVAILPRLAMGRLPRGITVHTLPNVERHVVAFTRPGSAGRPAVALVLDELARAGRRRFSR